MLCAIATTLAAASASAALSTKARISHSGLGPVKLGMTEAQVERAAKRAINSSSATPGCGTAPLAGKTYGLFTGKRLRRIYVNTPRFATSKGVRVGSSERRLLAAYPGRLKRQPQHYSPEEDELVWRSDRRKIIFTMNDEKVAGISTGRIPEIDLVEGCS